MNLNSSMATTLEDCLLELGGIPASRVRLSPPPGQATLADLLAVNLPSFSSSVASFFADLDIGIE